MRTTSHNRVTGVCLQIRTSLDQVGFQCSEAETLSIESPTLYRVGDTSEGRNGRKSLAPTTTFGYDAEVRCGAEAFSSMGSRSDSGYLQHQDISQVSVGIAMFPATDMLEWRIKEAERDG